MQTPRVSFAGPFGQQLRPSFFFFFELHVLKHKRSQLPEGPGGGPGGSLAGVSLKTWGADHSGSKNTSSDLFWAKAGKCGDNEGTI